MSESVPKYFCNYLCFWHYLFIRSFATFWNAKLNTNYEIVQYFEGIWCCPQFHSVFAVFNFWWWKILQFAYYLDVKSMPEVCSVQSRFWWSFLIFYLSCKVYSAQRTAHSAQCTLNSFKYGRKHRNLLLSMSNCMT